MINVYLKYLFVFGILASLISCSSAVRYSSADKRTATTQADELYTSSGFSQTGMASFYADKFEGRTTASGEIFSQQKLTAAHQTLPFGIKLRVTNLKNGKNVIVTVNDRGPYIAGRIIDLSKAAAECLGMLTAGITKVKIEIINK